MYGNSRKRRASRMQPCHFHKLMAHLQLPGTIRLVTIHILVVTTGVAEKTPAITAADGRYTESVVYAAMMRHATCWV